jgi:hypothetical protein
MDDSNMSKDLLNLVWHVTKKTIKKTDIKDNQKVWYACVTAGMQLM